MICCVGKGVGKPLLTILKPSVRAANVASSRPLLILSRTCSGTKNESEMVNETPMRQHQKYRTSKMAKSEDILEIEDEDELQPEWKALEQRITSRAHKPKGTVRSGRGRRNPSAWDAENV